MESEPQAPWYYLRPEWFHSTFDISTLPEDQLEGGRQELRRLIFKIRMTLVYKHELEEDGQSFPTTDLKGI